MSKDNFTDEEYIKKQKREEKKTKDALAKLDYDKLMGELETEKIKKRSKGVTILSCFHIAFGIILIIASIFLSIFKESKFIPFTAPFILVIGIGLFKLKEWARKAIIIFYVLFFLIVIALSIWISYKDPQMSISKIIIYMMKNSIPQWILTVISIYFFTHPKVKEQFR